MKVGVIGAGFVGTAIEQGLSLVCEVLIHDKYKPSQSLETVVDESQILFLALPTPMNEDGSCNLSIIEEVLEKINRVAEKKKTIVIKSTVPPGNTRRFQSLYPKHLLVFNPEFITEAHFIDDFLNQDRIILGFVNSKCNKLVDLYSQFIKFRQLNCQIVVCKAEEAEMTKYVANCFLATKVSFFNEMYDICKSLKIDYDTVLKNVLLDKRIGNSHTLVPGPDGQRGWGLSCFPKDLNAIRSLAIDNDCDTIMLDATWAKNLMVRKEYDWEKLAQVTGQYKEKK